MAGRVEPAAKRVLRGAYRLVLGAHARLSGHAAGAAPRVYYGGARAGDGGGTRVKVGRLAGVFPERRWDYNIVYVLSNAPYLPASALAALKARGIAVVCNQNGVFFPAWYGGDCAAENRRMAAQYHLADHVFHQSAFCRRAAERFLGVRQGPSEVLYNAVDTARFVPFAGERDAGHGFRFLLAGRIPAHQAHRLTVAVEALGIARRRGLDARLRAAGVIDAEAVAAARRLADGLGLAGAVAWNGRYRQDEAPALFAEADAFILVNHNDACPSTAIEAMAAGLPVVYARSGGVPELVGDEAGVGIDTPESWDEPQVPPASAVAEAMLRVAEGHAAMAKAARRRAVERFDIGPWIERHRAVFAHLLEPAA